MHLFIPEPGAPSSFRRESLTMGEQGKTHWSHTLGRLYNPLPGMRNMPSFDPEMHKYNQVWAYNYTITINYHQIPTYDILKRSWYMPFLKDIYITAWAFHFQAPYRDDAETLWLTFSLWGFFSFDLMYSDINPTKISKRSFFAHFEQFHILPVDHDPGGVPFPWMFVQAWRNFCLAISACLALVPDSFSMIWSELVCIPDQNSWKPGALSIVPTTSAVVGMLQSEAFVFFKPGLRCWGPWFLASPTCKLAPDQVHCHGFWMFLDFSDSQMSFVSTDQV